MMVSWIEIQIEEEAEKASSFIFALGVLNPCY